MDLGFLAKATGIVFRESFEAVLIYGIIVSYFQKHDTNSAGLRSAKLGLFLGVLMSVILGIALAGAIPAFSPELFANIEIVICMGGSLMMLYMVFWMSEHARHLKKDVESGISQNSSKSIVGAVFVAVFREGTEAVVYLYSLALESPTLVHRSAVLLSLVIGVALAFLVYRLMIHGSKHLSMKAIFRVSGLWLLFSSSSLMATSLDKIYSAGFLEKLSSPLFTIPFPEFLSKVVSFFESFVGFRAEPSLPHLVVFLCFWVFVIVKDPIKLRSSNR